MYKIIFAIVINFLTNNKIVADVPQFDVVTMIHRESMLYFQVEKIGNFNPQDSNYYDYEGKNLGHIDTLLNRWFSTGSVREYFTEVHRIDARKLVDMLDVYDSILYVFRGAVIFNADSLLPDLQFVSIESGNTYGHTFSAILSESDNDWLASGTVEKLFSFEGGLCHMRLIAKTGVIKEPELTALQQTITYLAQLYDWEPLHALLNVLHGRHVIMIGFCSC